MRNTRQFVNGMKNYLVKHGERDFHTVVLQERNKVQQSAVRRGYGLLVFVSLGRSLFSVLGTLKIVRKRKILF